MPSTIAFLDGQCVPIVFDPWLPVSYCPPPWLNGSVANTWMVFSFACLLSLSASPQIGCLVPGCDWINTVVLAHRGISVF